MSDFNGKFVWYELMTSDMKAAETFYRAVMGWDAADAGMPGMSYTLFSAGSDRVAGLMTVPEDAAAMGAKPGWIGYIATDDVDATAAKIAQAGGRVFRQPEDIPGVGRFAVMADLHGAVFCLFKGTGEMPEMAGMEAPGHFGWHELHAGNGPAAFDFYSQFFGWTKGDAMDMGDHGVYQIFNKDDRMLGGIMTKMAEMPMPFWLYYVSVPSIEAAAGRITANGGKIVNGPMEVPGQMWIVQGLDPQGAMFAMVGPKN